MFNYFFLKKNTARSFVEVPRLAALAGGEPWSRCAVEIAVIRELLIDKFLRRLLGFDYDMGEVY